MNNLFPIARETIMNCSWRVLIKLILKNQKKIIIIFIDYKHPGDYYQKENKKEFMKVTNN